MEYVYHLGCVICIYGILALSLDIVLGRSGLLSIAHGCLFGLGAYVSAILTLSHGLPFFVSFTASALVAAIVSTALLGIGLRLKDDVFMVFALAFQVVVVAVLANLDSVTRGPFGIQNIPAPQVLGVTVEGSGEFLIVSLACLAAFFIFVSLIQRSPFGKAMIAIREDSILIMSSGTNPRVVLSLALAVGGLGAGAAGSLFAFYIGYIDPSSFSISESILIMAMVLIGGAGRGLGVLVGAAFLVLLPEALRFAGFDSSQSAQLRQLIYGCLLIVISLVRPRGLLGNLGEVRRRPLV